MGVQYKFFIIPIRAIEETETEINRFLRTVRVVNSQREFIAQGENSFWTLSVEYLPDVRAGESSKGRGKERIDYREVLSPEDFALFSKIREWRKQISAKQNLPVYAVLKNDQIARIAQARPLTKEALKGIEGIGDARADKYADDLLGIVGSEKQQKAKENNDETDGKSVPADSDS